MASGANSLSNAAKSWRFHADTYASRTAFPDGTADVFGLSCCAEALASRNKHEAVMTVVLIRRSSPKDAPTVQNQQLSSQRASGTERSPGWRNENQSQVENAEET